MSNAQETIELVKQLQGYDVESIVRSDELGSELDFSVATESAKKFKQLYSRISIPAIESLPEKEVNKIKQNATADLKSFQTLLDFSTTTAVPANQTLATRRDQLVKAFDTRYETTFGQMYPYISYSAAFVTDFKLLEQNARDSVERVKTEAQGVIDQIKNLKGEADKILGDVRATAAEQGVTQQAIYFGEESTKHGTESGWWLKATCGAAILLCGFAIASLWLHKLIPVSNTFDSFQLAVSKFLLFGTISFVLYLSARNFLAHKHNSIVNKHRQNALLTYKALVDASGPQPENSLVILNQAANCIFSAQSTGYTKPMSSDGSVAKTVIDAVAKPLSGAG